MKLKELSEMTLRMGKAGNNLANGLEYAFNDRKSYKHVGDIQDSNVLHKGDIYLIVSPKDQPVGIFQIIKNGDTALVQNMYVVSEHRKKGWMSMFLFFLKQNESYSRIQLGDIQSEDTVEAVKRIYVRFDTNWINKRNGERVKYDPDTINNFYSIHKATDWNIVLENDGDFSHCPKFWDKNAILQSNWILYEQLLDYQDYFD